MDDKAGQPRQIGSSVGGSETCFERKQRDNNNVQFRLSERCLKPERTSHLNELCQGPFGK